MTTSSEKVGVYPGTFDPITNGHFDIISRAARHLCDRLIVSVAINAGKGPLFTLEERAQMVREEVATLSPDLQARIEVVPFKGLLMHHAVEMGAGFIVRGLRAVSDFEYEFQMASVNNKIAPELETVFLTASEATHFISSRFVKQLAELGGDVSHFVSDNVADALRTHFMVPRG